MLARRNALVTMPAMSMNQPMDRRELLKIMAMTLGSSIALPESVFARLAEPVDPASLKFFSPAQRTLVAAIAETIIPKTEALLEQFRSTPP